MQKHQGDKYAASIQFDNFCNSKMVLDGGFNMCQLSLTKFESSTLMIHWISQLITSFQRWYQQPIPAQGLDVSDAGGVFDLICEQLDGETLSAKGI